MSNSNSKSNHILNTSSNLLGFCLVVLTSLKISNLAKTTLIDEFTGIACILLIASSLLSFLSIRTQNEKLTCQYENIADKIFIVALMIVFAITFMVAFSIFF